MTKYFCDLCKREMGKNEHYIYILPQLIPYDAISTRGEQVYYTYEQLEDKEVEVCNVCRRKISQVLKEIEVKEKS